MLRFLAGEWGEDEAREQTVRATRRFARRQESWFRRDPRVIWLDAGPGADLPARALATIERCHPPRSQLTERQFTEHEFSQREFAKGHGTENDFVILPDPRGEHDLTPAAGRAAVRPAGRDRRGRGAAGGPYRRAAPGAAGPARMTAEWFMDYRNADGSIAEMCGNGIRVFARYLLEHGLAAGPSFAVATRSGSARSGPNRTAGSPWTWARSACSGPGRTVIGGAVRDGLRVSVGNPHLACLVDDALDKFDLAAPPGLDPADFPDGGNVELVRRTGPDAHQHAGARAGLGRDALLRYRRRRGRGGSSLRYFFRNENRPRPVARHGAGWRAAGDAGRRDQLADRACGDRGRGGTRPGLAGGPLAGARRGLRRTGSPVPARPVSSDTGAPRSDASSTSAMCAMAGGLCDPAAAIAALICRLQPGLAEMTSGAPVASTEAALRAPSSPAASGCSRLYTPAEPQQVPGSDGSTRSSPGMPPSSSRGWRRMPCACPR